jgi:hypothetical protein
LFLWSVLIPKAAGVGRVVDNLVDEDSNSLFKIDFLRIALNLGINNINNIG